MKHVIAQSKLNKSVMIGNDYQDNEALNKSTSTIKPLHKRSAYSVIKPTLDSNLQSCESDLNMLDFKNLQ